MGAVDVVVPCFNGERTLEATLESALAQEGLASLTVVDDGSSDGSPALARRVAPRVAVLTGPNRGVAAARNRGAAQGRAPWLLFLDADDLLVPGTLARRLAAGDEADAVICDWEEFDDGEEGGRPRAVDWAGLRADPERAVAAGAWAPPAAILYRRDLFARTGGFRGDLQPIEDARMLFDVARLGARLAPAGHCGARYRVLPGSLSRADPARFWTSVLRSGLEIEALWRADGAFGPGRRQAVAGIYDNAGRALLRAGHPDFFRAAEAGRRRGLPRSRHARVATPLARILGLPAARRIVGWLTPR